jgi:hypothetical protein
MEFRGSSVFEDFFGNFSSIYKHLASCPQKIHTIKLSLETIAWQIYLRTGLSNRAK